MNDVVFIKQQGGLGRALPGSDYLSAMLFYTNNLPTGFTTSLNKKQVFQVSDAEALGIADTYTDETQATAVITITGTVTASDTLTVNVSEPGVNGATNVVNLCSAVVAGGTSASAFATAIMNAINANSYATGQNGLAGYTATNPDNSGIGISNIHSGAAGSGYAANDTGTVNTGTTLATYKVLTVTGGAVATYQITAVGKGYTVTTDVATTATSGSGTGFAIDITALASQIDITARVGTGISLDTGTPLAVTVTGTSAITVGSQFSGGVYSQLALWHYHISEYFRLNPTGNLWLGFYPVPSSYTFTELQDLQQFAGGTIRQCLIYHLAARTVLQVSEDCTAIQASEAILEGLHMPLSVIYAPNIAAVSSLATLQNLGLLTANKVSVCISQDAGGEGALLYLTSGVSVTTGGALLGAVSSAPVNVDIAWVANYNMSDGVEDAIIGFSNGQLYTSISTNLLNQLDAYRYIFLRTFVDFTGSFFNDSHCAIAESSDYAYIENNRTIDKAIRVGRAALLPLLNSPILVNADGTITGNSIAVFRGALQQAADPMIRAGEISADGITISPTQQILSTSNFYIGFQIVPTGTARNISVNIGFAQAVSNG